MSDIANTSTRPYLIRALHEWCTDNGLTPYIAAHVDGSVQVPLEFVKDSEIVLNVSYDATSGLRLGNDFVAFKARFGGVARDIMVPVDHVVAIYARENGQGMAFAPPVAPEHGAVSAIDAPAAAQETPAPAAPVQLVVAAAADEAPAKKPGKRASDAGRDGDGDGAPDGGGDDDPTPPAPPSQPGARPSLKLVK